MADRRKSAIELAAIKFTVARVFVIIEKTRSRHANARSINEPSARISYRLRSDVGHKLAVNSRRIYR